MSLAVRQLSGATLGCYGRPLVGDSLPGLFGLNSSTDQIPDIYIQVSDLSFA